MMTEEMMKHMPSAMHKTAEHVMKGPLAQGAMMAATGFAAGRSLLGFSLLRNPLTLLAGGLAAGVAVGFLAHKYEKEIIESLANISGMGKDFALNQKENLGDLMAEAEEKISTKAPVSTPTPAATPVVSATPETPAV